MSRLTIAILAAIACSVPVTILSAFMVGLTGCDQGGTRATNTKTSEACYRVTFYPPSDAPGFHKIVWEVKKKPTYHSNSSVFEFVTDDGREVVISGLIIIEQTTRTK